jgi:hypothetical protein
LTASTAEVTDLEPIVPDRALVDVEGIRCRVGRLRAREVLSLARVVAAIGTGVVDLDLDLADEEKAKAQVAGMLMVALPYAQEETFQFFRDVVKAVNPDDQARLAMLMQNPDPLALLDVLERIVDAEGAGLLELVGKARTLGSKLGDLIGDRKTAGTGGRSPAPST